MEAYAYRFLFINDLFFSYLYLSSLIVASSFFLSSKPRGEGGEVTHRSGAFLAPFP